MQTYARLSCHYHRRCVLLQHLAKPDVFLSDDDEVRVVDLIDRDSHCGIDCLPKQANPKATVVGPRLRDDVAIVWVSCGVMVRVGLVTNGGVGSATTISVSGINLHGFVCSTRPNGTLNPRSVDGVSFRGPGFTPALIEDGP